MNIHSTDDFFDPLAAETPVDLPVIENLSVVCRDDQILEDIETAGSATVVLRMVGGRYEIVRA